MDSKVRERVEGRSVGSKVISKTTAPPLLQFHRPRLVLALTSRIGGIHTIPRRPRLRVSHPWNRAMTLGIFGGTSLITHCLESFDLITKLLTHCSEWQLR